MKNSKLERQVLAAAEKHYRAEYSRNPVTSHVGAYSDFRIIGGWVTCEVQSINGKHFHHPIVDMGTVPRYLARIQADPQGVPLILADTRNGWVDGYDLIFLRTLARAFLEGDLP